jgi:hypothetical protein
MEHGGHNSMRALLAMFMLAMASQACHADILTGVRILKVYAQSRQDSDAHLIMIDQAISSACNANRLYIEINDKELFASALANYMADRSVDVVFVTNSAPKTAAGHTAGLTCRLVSIF